MTFDIPHMIASVLILFSVQYGLQHVSAYESAGKLKKATIMALVLFPVLLVLNLFWPYGSGA